MLLVLAACGGAGSVGGPTATTSAQGASPSELATAEPSRAAVCPNPYGGACLGELARGTYTTQMFATPLTYTVGEGWTNDEDLPGNFIVLPPTASRAEIDAGTADYVAVYDGIAVASADCGERPQSGLDSEPRAMAAWFGAHEGLEVTAPAQITVGGLDGVVIDLVIADGYTGGCPYPGFEGIPIVPMIIGAGPAELHHVALGENVTRLYLLQGRHGRIIAIEVSDVPGGTGLDELDAVVGDFVFSTAPG